MVARKTPIGKKITTYVKKGNMIPDSWVIQMLRSRLEKPDVLERGAVVDGFPRTKNQAQELISQSEIVVEQVILFDVVEEVSLDRIKNRRIYPANNDAIYNLKYRPPPPDQPWIEKGLITRENDKSPQAIQKRLQFYRGTIENIMANFDQSKIAKIDGSRTIEEVFAEVEAVVKPFSIQPENVSGEGLRLSQEVEGFNPAKDMDDAVRISAAPIRRFTKEQEVPVAITVTTPNVTVRVPVDVACVIDVSGSMRAEATFQDPNDETRTIGGGMTQLDLVKHAVKTIIHTLSDLDRLSLVSFNGDPKVVMQLTQMNPQGREKALEALNRLQEGGVTNIWGGLESGLKSISEKGKKASPCGVQFSHQKGVILLTDGQPNRRPPEGEVKALEKFLASHPTDFYQVFFLSLVQKT